MKSPARGEVSHAEREVARCRKNLAKGGDPVLWIWRLKLYLDDLDNAADVLREQLRDIYEKQGRQ